MYILTEYISAQLTAFDNILAHWYHQEYQG